MSIVKLTDNEIAQLKIGCPTLSKFNLGSLINDIIDSTNDNTPCSFVMDQDTIYELDHMCSFNGEFLGTLLYNIIEATKEDIELEELSKSVKKALNSTCGTLDGIDLGDKLEEIIESLNAQDVPIPVISVSIPESKSVVVGETINVDITWNPSNATDKVYTVTPDVDTICECEVLNANSFKVIGKSEGDAKVTLVPHDGGEALKQMMIINVVTE